jgi:hypothetical protein
MTLVKQLSVFGMKLETTPVTKQALLAADCAFNVYDFEIEPDIEVEERMAQGSFGTRRTIPGGRKAKATLKMDVEFDGIAVPAWADVIFPACGLVKTGNVFNPKTQTPDTPSAVVKTATIGKWCAGKFIGLFGAMGTFKQTFPTAKISTYEFEFQGVLDPEVDQATPSPTYPTPNQLVTKGGPMSWAGSALCMESITFDLANTLYVKQCPSNVNGYEFCVITGRKPRFTGNPESRLVAAQNRMGQMLAGTEGIVRCVLPAVGYVSGTGAKSYELLANQAQIVEKKPGDREGVSVDDLTLQCNIANGTADSDFSITFNL